MYHSTKPIQIKTLKKKISRRRGGLLYPLRFHFLRTWSLSFCYQCLCHPQEFMTLRRAPPSWTGSPCTAEIGWVCANVPSSRVHPKSCAYSDSSCMKDGTDCEGWAGRFTQKWCFLREEHSGVRPHDTEFTVTRISATVPQTKCFSIASPVWFGFIVRKWRCLFPPPLGFMSIHRRPNK